MFPQQPQQQFRNTNADVQFFYRSSNWTKPPGVNFVYILAIGAGGAGNGSTGGASGAVNRWFGNAQQVPDNLTIAVGSGNSVIRWRGVSGTPYNLISADAANGVTPGGARSGSEFTICGLYQSVAGQAGTNSTVTASTTTFLGGGATNSCTGNYGYTSIIDGVGYFQLQPIIVGFGSSKATGPGGIGCGGSPNSDGGAGLVIIASW